VCKQILSPQQISRLRARTQAASGRRRLCFKLAEEHRSAPERPFRKVSSRCTSRVPPPASASHGQRARAPAGSLPTLKRVTGYLAQTHQLIWMARWQETTASTRSGWCDAPASVAAICARMSQPLGENGTRVRHKHSAVLLMALATAVSLQTQVLLCAYLGGTGWWTTCAPRPLRDGSTKLCIHAWSCVHHFDTWWQAGARCLAWCGCSRARTSAGFIRNRLPKWRHCQAMLMS
jgi:hypothetical protein